MYAAEQEDLDAAAARIGFHIPPGDQRRYLDVIRKSNEMCLQVLNIPGESLSTRNSIRYLCTDYKPEPRLAEFKRKDVHFPSHEDNLLRGWAWRCDVGGNTGNNKLLSGKTVILKDSICLAEIPLLFGTEAFKDYIRKLF
jgi:amidase